MMYISVLWRNLYRTKTHNKYTSDNAEVKGNYQRILWDARGNYQRRRPQSTAVWTQGKRNRVILIYRTPPQRRRAIVNSNFNEAGTILI